MNHYFEQWALDEEITREDQDYRVSKIREIFANDPYMASATRFKYYFSEKS